MKEQIYGTCSNHRHGCHHSGRNDVPSFWESLKTGKCGIGPITKFDVSDFKVKLGAESRTSTRPSIWRSVRRAAQMQMCITQWRQRSRLSSRQASRKAISIPIARAYLRLGRRRSACCRAGGPEAARKGPGRVSPFAIPEMIANIAAAYISMHFGFKGENFCPVSACATGNHSIGEAMRAIATAIRCRCLRWHRERHYPISMAGFQNMKAVTW